MKIVLRFPLLVPLASFCLVSAMFAPMEYSVGIAYVGRTGNVVQLVIWLLGVLNEIYLVCYLMQHLTKTRMTAWIGRGTAICSVGALVIAFVFVCATYRTVSYTSVTALLSWKSGELAEYDAQVEERLTVLEDKNTDEVLLAPLTTHPYLLYFDDITDNPRDWRNKGMARFYQKSSVCLKE
jgi:hypothetical protein